LTLYALESVDVLQSEPYHRLLDNPTPWSRSMRPSFRGFARLACERRWTSGGGVGGWLAALPLDEAAAVAWQALATALDTLPPENGLVAAHVLLRDPAIADVPFAIGGEAPEFPRAGAVLVEFFDDPAAAGRMAALAACLAGAGAGEATLRHLTAYRLAYALGTGSLARLRPPPSPS